MYYVVDQNSKIIFKSIEQPVEQIGTVLTYSNDLDLECYDWFVGAVKDGVITYLNPPKPKPTEQLISIIKENNNRTTNLEYALAELAYGGGL